LIKSFVILCTDSYSIQDVVLFFLMLKEENENESFVLIVGYDLKYSLHNHNKFQWKHKIYISKKLITKLIKIVLPLK